MAWSTSRALTSDVGEDPSACVLIVCATFLNGASRERVALAIRSKSFVRATFTWRRFEEVSERLLQEVRPVRDRRRRLPGALQAKDEAANAYVRHFAPLRP